MTNLEKEAYNYADEIVCAEFDVTWNKSIREYFIAGSNSNYVKSEKLKAQIEVLEKVFNDKNGDINNQIYNLKEELKKLTNEH